MCIVSNLFLSVLTGSKSQNEWAFFVVANDETTACNKVRASFIKWKYPPFIVVTVCELIAREEQYPRECDYLIKNKEDENHEK